MCFGVVVFDREGNRLLTNAMGRAILEEKDGLSMGPRGLVASRSRDTDEIGALIERALGSRGEPTLEGVGALQIARPSGRQPLDLLVLPLPTAQSGRGDAAAVYLFDPARSRETPASVLSQVYNLTPAEARLAADLTLGVSLEDTARARGLSIHTVRSQIKAIFSKTQTSRQSELVRRLLTGPAALVFGLRPGEPAPDRRCDDRPGRGDDPARPQ
jgi:DNA-binding CsgD family transcriptional regulator